MIAARSVLLVGAAILLAGCASTPKPSAVKKQIVIKTEGSSTRKPKSDPGKTEGEASAPRPVDPAVAATYAEIKGEPYPVPAVDLEKVDRRYLRAEGAFRSAEKPGTVFVDLGSRSALVVLGGGRAMRYGIAVGPDAVHLPSEMTVSRKAEWPDATPAPEPVAPEPKKPDPKDAKAAKPKPKGKDGKGATETDETAPDKEPAEAAPEPAAVTPPQGTRGPLGSRALYIGNGEVYPILHAIADPLLLGKDMPSGAIGLTDQDMIDLYRRVPDGAKVIVLQR